MDNLNTKLTNRADSLIKNSKQIEKSINKIAELVIRTIENKGKLMFCGNGGKCCRMSAYVCRILCNLRS